MVCVELGLHHSFERCRCCWCFPCLYILLFRWLLSVNMFWIVLRNSWFIHNISCFFLHYLLFLLHSISVEDGLSMWHGWWKLSFYTVITIFTSILIQLIIRRRSSRIIIQQMRSNFQNSLVTDSFYDSFYEIVLIFNHLHAFFLPCSCLIQVLSAIIGANSGFFMGMRTGFRLFSFIFNLISTTFIDRRVA